MNLIGLTVWHSKYKKGSIIKEEKFTYLIEFTVGEKSISKNAFGHTLFFDEKEIMCTDKQWLEQKYSNISSLVKFNEISTRNFVVISNELEIIKGKQFYRLIAIDVFTAEVVVLVDTNGAEFGLHTTQKDVIALQNLHVIQAPVRLILDGKCHNMLRIAGPIKCLGKSNLERLKEKYNTFKEISNYPNHDFITSFDEAFFLAHENNGRDVFVVVNFTGTEIRRNSTNMKYQIKMDNVFADVEDVLLDKKNDNQYYRGLALVKLYVQIGERRVRPVIIKLLSKPTLTPTKNIKKVELQQDNLKKACADVQNNDYSELLFSLMSFENIGNFIENKLSDCDGTLTADDTTLYTGILTKISFPLANWNSAEKKELFDKLIIKFVRQEGENISFDTWSSTNTLNNLEFRADEFLFSCVLVISDEIIYEMKKYLFYKVNNDTKQIDENKKHMYRLALEEIESAYENSWLENYQDKNPWLKEIGSVYPDIPF